MAKTYTVSEILDIVRSVYMNDPTSGIYTNAKLLPSIKLAYQSLETELEKHNITCKNAKSDEFKVPAGDKVIPTPGDFLMPISIVERNWGSQDRFTDVQYRRWAPDRLASYQLEYYDWQGDIISTPGSTMDKGVVIYYQKQFPALQQVSDFVLGKSEQYLASRTAALAHMFISQNAELAEVCKSESENNLEQILSIYIKRTQSAPARRKGYTPPYRY